MFATGTALGDLQVRPRRSGIVLATLLTCQLMIIVDATVVNVALPRLQAELRFSDTGLSWVGSAIPACRGC